MGLVKTFKGNVNRTNTVDFDAHWTSEAKKEGFEISLATDLYLSFSPLKIYLTNRFHVAVRLFRNRSQMTSKCGKNKKVAHEA